MKIEVDIGGALKKTAALSKVPKAALKQLQRWGANSVKELKLVARGMQKSDSGRKTGQLARSIGMKMDSSGRMLVVGTNIEKQTDVKYAKIQDEGGTIRPKDHPYLAIPFPGIKDRPKDHPDAFVIETKKGNVLLVEQSWTGAGTHEIGQRSGYSWGKTGKRGWRGSGYKRGIRMLFVLKDEVTLPPTRWFSGTMRMMESLLPAYMDEKVILDEAAKMAGFGGEE